MLVEIFRKKNSEIKVQKLSEEGLNLRISHDALLTSITKAYQEYEISHSEIVKEEWGNIIKQRTEYFVEDLLDYTHFNQRMAGKKYIELGESFMFQFTESQKLVHKKYKEGIFALVRYGKNKPDFANAQEASASEWFDVGFNIRPAIINFLEEEHKARLNFLKVPLEYIS